jgi:hypothetical protein
MEKLKVKIKAESLPERCEICHKNDKFYPRKNYCGRCNYIIGNTYKVKSKSKSQNNGAIDNFRTISLLSISRFITSVFIVIFFGIAFELIGLFILFIVFGLLRALNINLGVISLFIFILMFGGSFIFGAILGINLIRNSLDNTLIEKDQLVEEQFNEENVPYWANKKNMNA